MRATVDVVTASLPTAVSVVGFLVLAGVGVAMEHRGRQRPGAARAAAALAAAMRTTPGRVAVLSWWLWLGVHFLAR